MPFTGVNPTQLQQAVLQSLGQRRRGSVTVSMPLTKTESGRYIDMFNMVKSYQLYTVLTVRWPRLTVSLGSPYEDGITFPVFLKAASTASVAKYWRIAEGSGAWSQWYECDRSRRGVTTYNHTFSTVGTATLRAQFKDEFGNTSPVATVTAAVVPSPRRQIPKRKKAVVVKRWHKDMENKIPGIRKERRVE